MVAPRISEARFIEEFNDLGPHALARRYDLTVRQVYRRRRNLERLGYELTGPSPLKDRVKPVSYPWQIELDIEDGTVLIGSDAHHWPGRAHVTHRAFVAFCKEFKPKAVIINGDLIDAPTISRFSPTSWAELGHRPKLADEIETAKQRMAEIEKAAFKARKIFTIGNHDERFEKSIVARAPEYAQIHGVSLASHFPLWELALSCLINDDVYVTHQFRGGEHATYNNAVKSGKTTITGHLHNANVRPITDLNGTRYGVDTGTLADVNHLAFLYTRMVPRSWRSGFCLLTFKGGLLLQPELVLKWSDKSVQFRGEIITP